MTPCPLCFILTHVSLDCERPRTAEPEDATVSVCGNMAIARGNPEVAGAYKPRAPTQDPACAACWTSRIINNHMGNTVLVIIRAILVANPLPRRCPRCYTVRNSWPSSSQPSWCQCPLDRHVSCSSHPGPLVYTPTDITLKKVDGAKSQKPMQGIYDQ